MHSFLFKTLRYSNPCTGLDRPWGFQEVEAPISQDRRHMKVAKFYILLTVHPGMIPVNNQLNVQFFKYVYFYFLHVSGMHVPIIRRIIVSMRHPVYVTLCRWPSDMQEHMLLHTRRYVENRNKYKKNCASSCLFTRKVALSTGRLYPKEYFC